MALDPFTGSLITGGLSLIQGALGSGAQQQEYLNQTAYKKASDQFARWSAGFQAKQTDLNNQYRHWQEQVNYGQELVYTNQLRNWELSKAITNAEEIARVRSSAGADYVRSSAALSEGFAQQAASDAISLFQYKQQAMKMMAAASGGQEGQSANRIVNDYARQLGDMETIRAIQDGFRRNQYSREQAGQVASYLNQYNSQQYYKQQQYMDPIAPFAPLPTLVMPAGPSMVGSAPSTATALLGATIGAVSAGFNTYTNLSAYTGGGKPSGGKG
jgi:hypothetical protein